MGNAPKENSESETYITKKLQEYTKRQLDNLHNLDQQITPAFAQAVQLILASPQAPIITMALGKSGHIARKIAATLASTGTPAYFIHPTEAAHGDLGMIAPNSIILLLSHSGNSDEINILIPELLRRTCKIIALTGTPNSPLTKHADISIHYSIKHEACPLKLAPSSSSTTALILGDTLALTLMDLKKITLQDFAHSHPSGSLGKHLTMRVASIMSSKLPLISPSATIKEAILIMNSHGLGMTAIADNNAKLAGIFTDGDLRRTISNNVNLTTPISKVMTTKCLTINPDELAINALAKMEQAKITTLVVTNPNQEPLGILHMHHLIEYGLTN